jgi:hypothetical protein
VRAQQALVSPIPGWFVPDALWLEINEALEKAAQ